MSQLGNWLGTKFEQFELRVRAGRTKGGNDTYYRAGWADGYKAAQKDARKADRTELATTPRDRPTTSGETNANG